jgi:hypothetical protein
VQRYFLEGCKVSVWLQFQKSKHDFSCLGYNKYDGFTFPLLNLLFLPPAYENCVPETFWNSVSIVNYVKHLYAVLWGCRNLPNNKHEQGAWILGYKSNFSEASKLLNQAFFVDLNFTKASIKDFVLYNQTYSGKTTGCTYKVCKYNQLCKSDDVDDDENENE